MGERPYGKQRGHGSGRRRSGIAAAALVAAFAMIGLFGPGAGPAAAQHAAFQIDCPDAPLYAAGGFSLVRDMQAAGLVLSVRLQHNRTLEHYAVTCTTAAAGEPPPGDSGTAAAGTAEYDFICTARVPGRTALAGRASMRGAVPGGYGLDHPETQAAIGAAVCPAARLALARLRAGRN